MAAPQKLFGLLLVTLVACAMERRPRRGNCRDGTQCSNDACAYAHPGGKMFCKLTRCKGGHKCHASHGDPKQPPEECRYLHQCPNEKGRGRKRCHNKDCKYDHLNNITLNQARQVVEQKGGSCQSHALAAWLTNWIERSEDPEYQRLAQVFRCKAEGDRLYDVMVRHFAADYKKTWRRTSFNGWLDRMVKEVIPDGYVSKIVADRRYGTKEEGWAGRSSQVKHLLAVKDMPLIFMMGTTDKRMNAFRLINTFGKQETDHAFQEFWRLKDSCAARSGWEAGHAMLCCPDPHHGGFAIKNSWGKTWADKGIVYLRPWRCDDDSDLNFHRIEIPDRSPLNLSFFDAYL